MDSKLSKEYVHQLESAKEGVQDVTQDYVPGSDEEKKLVRKIDSFLLPTIFFMYLFSYMDRTKYVFHFRMLICERARTDDLTALGMQESREWLSTSTSAQISILLYWSYSSSVTFSVKFPPSEFCVGCTIQDQSLTFY